MKKAVIFGAGRNYFDFEKEINEQYEIVGIVDNDSGKWGWNIRGITVARPKDLETISFDVV